MVLAQHKLYEMLAEEFTQFPSHYGSRSTEMTWLQGYLIVRFHPTMVLAQQEYLTSEGEAINVSIPLWFSLNGPRTTHNDNSHPGFHPTMVLAQPKTA